VPGYVLTWVDVARDQYAALEPDDQRLVDSRLAPHKNGRRVRSPSQNDSPRSTGNHLLVREDGCRP
jgi:hypothetical protein